MDIYSFFSSRDIADYCRSIGKTWTSFEMAALVDSSYHSISDKHTAWKEIITDFPDMPTPKNFYGDSSESLHKVLAEEIADGERLIEIFKEQESGAIYGYGALSGDSSDMLFDSFDAALSAAAAYYADDPYVSAIRLTKSFVNEGNKMMSAFFKNDKQLDCVRIAGSYEQYKLAPVDYRNYYLFAVDLDIPMPFKRGDILTFTKGWDNVDDGVVFVFDSFDSDNPEWSEWLEQYSNEGYRSFAESVRGLAIHAPGYLYNYTSVYRENLEYYRGTLEGDQRLLYYVSLHLKDKLKLSELFEMQRRIILQHQLENISFKLSRHLPDHIVVDRENNQGE